MAPCERRTGVRPPSRVPPSSFEGAARRPYKSGWHSVAELTLALPHSTVQWQDGLTGRVGGTAPGRDSQACQRRGVDSSLTLAPASVRALNAPVGGAGMGRRDHEALERGGTSPEGATVPRARRNLTRVGAQPSSEAEPHPRGRPALEQGGSLLVQCRTPRAKRSSARGWPGRLSGGPLGPPGPWARPLGRELS
jgi:hypothetical protein